MWLSPIIVRAGPPVLARPAAWFGFTWMGTIFLLLAAVVLAEPARQLMRILWAEADPELATSRRALLNSATTAVAGGTALLAAAGGAVRAAMDPVIQRIAVTIDRWPTAMNGYRIVHLTDIHVSQTVRAPFVRRLVEMTNALQPDMVVITGDLVDGTVEELGAQVESLRELSAPDGVFFVTGNHEYYSGVEGWMRFLPTLGVRVLRNEHAVIERPEGRFVLAGVDDHTAAQFGRGHGADPVAALADRPEGAPVVMLAHQPVQVHEHAGLGVDLQLSGHTHGGQIWPFRYLVPLQQPFVRGLHRFEQTQVYISCGCGYWGPPMRVGADPEIAVIELSSSEQATAGLSASPGHAPSHDPSA